MAFKKYSNFFFMITSFIDHIIYLYSRSAEVGSEMIRCIICNGFNISSFPYSYIVVDIDL